MSFFLSFFLSSEFLSQPARYKRLTSSRPDIIIRGGENIFPVVVENRALLLPGIADCSFVPFPPPPSSPHSSHFSPLLPTSLSTA